MNEPDVGRVGNVFAQSGHRSGEAFGMGLSGIAPRTVDLWSSYPPVRHRVTPLPSHSHSGAHSMLPPTGKDRSGKEVRSAQSDRLRSVDPGHAPPTFRVVPSDDRRPLARAPRSLGVV